MMWANFKKRRAARALWGAGICPKHICELNVRYVYTDWMEEPERYCALCDKKKIHDLNELQADAVCQAFNAMRGKA